MPSRHHYIYWIFPLALLLVARGATAAYRCSASLQRDEGLPTASVTFLNGNPIRLDGRLDDPAWQKVVPIGPLQMVEPYEARPPTEKTEVRVAATDTAIYFGIRCYDHDPAGVVSYTMQRDGDLRDEDHVKLVLDTFQDGRTGYVFAVNANGARYDALVAREGEGENANWDGIWEAAARRDAQGWTVEIRIPIKTLRFRPGSDTWGFNVERRIQRLQETDRWASPSRNFRVTHVSRAGRLTGLPAFRQGRGLTVRPYFLGGTTRSTVGGPFERRTDLGLDVIQNLGAGISGLISINTDFAETEVDTRQVNLTRFPLFFPEKRSFFLEGSDIFTFGLGLRHDLIPFFTRRIGLVAGQVVPLDLALKVTGHLGGTSFALLDTLTHPVSGLVPRHNLFAARVYQNLWSESKIGFLVTAGDPVKPTSSWLAGVDFTYKTSRFQGDKNFLIGIWGLISQRDVRDHAWGMKIDYPNDLWDIALVYKYIGPHFDPALGFVPWAGIHRIDFGADYMPRPSWTWLRQMFHEFQTHFVFDLDGHLMQWRIFMAPVNWRLESGDRFEFNIVPQGERIPEAFDITPEVFVAPGNYRWWKYRIEFETADKRRWKTRFTWWFGGFYNGHIDQLEVKLALRPSSHLNVSWNSEYNVGRLPTGRFRIFLTGARIGVYLSPDFQINTYIQYDNLSRSIGMNTRLRWTYRSLLDVFLVINRNWTETNGIFRSDLNQVLFKVQYAWRP